MISEIDSNSGSGLTVNILAAAVAACAYLSFGIDLISAVILFLPVRGLVGRLIANDGLGIVTNCSILLLYKLVMQLSSTTTAKLLDLAASHGGKVNAATTMIANACVGVLVIAAAYGIAGLIARLFGSFSLPKKIHSFIVLVLEASARVLLFAFGIAIVRYCDGRFVTIAPPLKMAIAILLGAGVIFSMMRMFKGGLTQQSSNDVTKPGSLNMSAKQTTRLSDVIGMEDAKEQIRLRLLEPVRNPAKARRYGLSIGGGVLLYGPPGTGKTMLARAVAGELHLPFFMITSADVFGKYVGESERNMRNIFAEVRKHKLSVLFIDELETLFPNRANDIHETTRKVISVILQELDGLDKAKNPILLLGATNVPWMVDEAFLRPGRFDIKIFVGLPDAQARGKMLAMALSKGSIHPENGLVEYMAARTNNYSGADLNGVVDRLRQLAYSSGAKFYGRELAEKAIAAVSPTASGEILDKIQEWESQAMPSNSRNSGSSGVRIASRPDVTLKDVVGMEDVKEEIRLRLIEPIKNASIASHYGLRVGGGMLLYGPPGTGKTFIARAVAGELGLPFYALSSADIFGKYVGESERNLKRIFRDIRKNELAVVFIDELETLFPKRTADIHESTRKIISMILQELDGLDKDKNPILLMGATNVPWMVDEAFLRPGRFDVCLYIGPPDSAARRQMSYNALESGEVPYEVGLHEYIAEHTEGFTGADIKGFFERMRQHAFKNRLSYYKTDTVDEILAKYSPSRNNELVAQIKQWESSR